MNLENWRSHSASVQFSFDDFGTRTIPVDTRLLCPVTPSHSHMHAHVLAFCFISCIDLALFWFLFSVFHGNKVEQHTIWMRWKPWTVSSEPQQCNCEQRASICVNFLNWLLCGGHNEIITGDIIDGRMVRHRHISGEDLIWLKFYLLGKNTTVP